MMSAVPESAVEKNFLLRTLPPQERRRLADMMDIVELGRGDVVMAANQPIRQVCFPVSGVLSMVVDMEDGRTVEVGTVGREGFAGIPLLLEAKQSPTRVYCQVPPCLCLRMRASDFDAEMNRSGSLRGNVLRYAQASLIFASQLIACGILHTVEQRLARWLLMTQDRVGDDSLNLTQQIISEMLGVRRAGVTTAAGYLQRKRWIRYDRGNIAILDREGLQNAVCECYGTIAREFERLLKVG
jgi:CRP-like cAMP-binding protein